MSVPAQYFYLLAIVLAVGITSLKGQEPAVKHFSVNEGLPSATIYQSMQDHDGFLWFATDVGVSRFDGRTFVNFTDADGLSENEVMDIKQDALGRIWFLGFNGTLCYLYKQQFHNSGNDPLLKNVKRDGAFLHYYEDKHHR